MDLDESSRRQSQSVEEFNQRESRSDGLRVVNSLAAGLSVLRDSLFIRMHEDVERVIGRDSMLIPVSELKAQKLTKREIEIYQLVESGAAAKEFGYIASLDWFADWLWRLRLAGAESDPNCRKRLSEYLGEPPQKRRGRFESALSKVLPESTRAPLVVFLLYPLCVQIVTAQAFADHARAARLRQSQVAILPAIIDCRSCHGKVLENGEQCAGCGNPLWKFSWLTAAD
jgi:hypothetical protein